MTTTNPRPEVSNDKSEGKSPIQWAEAVKSLLLAAAALITAVTSLIVVITKHP